MNKLTLFTPMQQQGNGGVVTRILEFIKDTNILNSIVFIKFFAKSLTFHSVQHLFIFFNFGKTLLIKYNNEIYSLRPHEAID